MKTTTEQQQQRTVRGPLVEALAETGCQVANDKRVACPFHQDDHPSAEIKQCPDGAWRFFCHAASCNFRGDVFDVRAKVSGKSVADVLAETRRDISRPRVGSQPAKEHTPSPEPKRYASIEAVTCRLPGFEGVWAWTDAEGGIICWTVRYRPPGKSKRMMQAMPCEGGVILKGPKPPYLLLYLSKINPAQSVVIAEGEPKADIINEVGLEGLVATSMLGGAGPKKEFLTDWRPLRGKTIFLWPDADIGGIDFMRAVAERLWSLWPRPKILWIEPAALGLSDKQDAVDYFRDVPEDQWRRKLLDALDVAEPWVSKRPTLAAGVRANTEAIISGKLADAPLPFRQLLILSRLTAPGIVSLLAGPGASIKTWILLLWVITWFDADIPFAYLGLEEDRTYSLERIQSIRERNIELLNPEWVKAHGEEKRAVDDRQESYLSAIGQSIWDAPNETMPLHQVSEWIRRRAAERRRLIIVDPVTAVEPVKDCYLADRRFLMEVKTIARLTNTTILVATHRAKGKTGFGLDDICGGAAYAQLTQSIVWVEPHRPPKEQTILTPLGRTRETIGLSLHIAKARKAPGTGKIVGISIDWPHVTFTEAGVVLKG